MMFKKIKKTISNIILSIRNVFIKEKRPYISYKTVDNINFSFKNMSIYSDIGIYKTIVSLFFIVIFLTIFAFFTYMDFTKNIKRNKELVKKEPLELVVKNPLNIDLPNYYKDLVYKIRRGDNLINILINVVGVPSNEAYDCVNSLKTVYDTNSLKIGQKLFIKYRDGVALEEKVLQNIELEELKIIDDNSLKEITVSRNNDGGFAVIREDVNLAQTYNKYIVNINNSVYYDTVNAGVPADVVATLINYYSFDIDFQRDIRKGDWLEVVFEAFYTNNGKKVKNGNIMYANLHTNKDDHKIYRFNNNYYNENGVSTQKSLLKTPINGARISSGFTTRRKHPVLGYTRAHKGIDFAAPIGTPFYAAGNGVITKVVTGCRVGDKYCGGGFGNYISIKHNNTYTTEYGHISRIANGVRVGKKVRQGDVIAYVGNTGLSTGPHLHYGVIYKGDRINPSRLRSTPLKRLSGRELLDFTETRDKINSMRINAVNQNILLEDR